MNVLEKRSAYMRFCAQMQPNAVITLATNQYWSIRSIKRLIGQFSARLDDAGLGSTWSKEPLHKRANGLFFVEHVHSNIHAHGLVHFPYGNDWGRKKLAEKFWRDLCPAGTIDFQDPYDLAGAAHYATKEMKKRSYDDDQIILLADFMSDKSLTALTN